MSETQVQHRQTGKANKRMVVTRLKLTGLPHSQSPQSVSITLIPKKRETWAKYAHLDKVEILKEEDVTPDTAANCYLQIWEFDFYRYGLALQKDEVDKNEKENRLLATFPGVVVSLADGT